MHMVSHEAVAKHVHVVLFHEGFEKRKVAASVFIIQKYILLIVASLGDMAGMVIC